MTKAKRLAIQLAACIRRSETYTECADECQELCRLAGLETEWKESDGETFEAVLYEAAEILGVDI